MKKSVAVLGLGKFGSSVARALTKGGAEVLAVDKNEDLVREIADEVTCTVCVDVSDKEMMNNIGLEGMDAVVIATAEHLDASVMALMIVKEIGVPYVLVKADGTLKGEILKRVGADEVVYPEEEMGARIANNLLGGSMTDLFDLSADTSIVKVPARKEWIIIVPSIELDDILDKMVYIQFGAVDDFLELMVAAQALPHTDLERYPSVMKKLEERSKMQKTVSKKTN